MIEAIIVGYTVNVITLFLNIILVTSLGVVEILKNKSSIYFQIENIKIKQTEISILRNKAKPSDRFDALSYTIFLPFAQLINIAYTVYLIFVLRSVFASITYILDKEIHRLKTVS